MNEPDDRRCPRWFARPIVWLCGGGLLLMLLAMAAWWGARTGVRAMQRLGAEPSWHVSDAAFWAEEHLRVSTDVWLLDGNVTVLYAQGGGYFERFKVDLNDAELVELRRFPNLTALDLSSISVTDEGIRQLLDAGGLRQLTFLQLNECHSLTGRSLAMLSRLPNLESLWVTSSPLAVSGADLSRLKKLRMLQTASIPLTNADLDAVARLPQIDWLGLGDTAIDDEGLAALAHCPQLTVLDLSRSRVTDAGVAQIAKYCPNLEMLLLEGTQVTDACLSLVAQMPRLSALYVGDTAVTEAAINEFMAAHPAIVVVTVDFESEE